MAVHADELRRHAVRTPSARSLLFTVLGEYVLPLGGAAWAGTLVDALGLLGVEEKAARQAVARTAKDGWLTGERSGRRVRWNLTGPGIRLLREGAERIYAFGGSPGAWEGRWLMLLVTVPEAKRELRHRLRVRLTWAGFASPAPGVWLSPHPDRQPEAAGVLDELGLGGTSFVARHGTVGEIEELVRETWDLAALERDYVAFLEDRCSPVPSDEAAAFASHTRLVHEWRRFPFKDPDLPGELLPAGWPGFRAHDVFQRRHAEGVDRATEWFRRCDGSG